jgi:hypothetical protein
VTNKAGEREFGKNEFFHVLSLNHLPVGLISPPGFLRDRLEGQAKTRGKDKAPTAGAGTESGGTTGGTGTSTQPSVATTTVFPTDPLGVNEFVPSDQPVVKASLINPSFAFAGAWAGYYNYGSGNTPDGGHDDGSGNTPDGGHDGIQVVFNGGSLSSVTDDGLAAAAAAAGGFRELFLNPFSASYTWEDGYGSTVHSTVSKGAAVEVGTNSAANLVWGRALIDWTDVGSTWSESGKEWDHFVIGDPVTALPTSGNYLYNWIGGTSPTDANGAVGTRTSGGSINVSFGASSIGMQTVTPITWTMPAGSANPGSYSLTFNSSTQQRVDTYAPAGLSVSYFDGIPSIPTSCPGTCYSYVKPQFMGASAQALGLGIYTDVNGGSNYIASAQAYKR